MSKRLYQNFFIRLSDSNFIFFPLLKKFIQLKFRKENVCCLLLFYLTAAHFYPSSKLTFSWYVLMWHKDWKLFCLVGHLFCFTGAHSILIKYFEYCKCQWHRTLNFQSNTYSDTWNSHFYDKFSMPTGIPGRLLCKIWLVPPSKEEQAKSSHFSKSLTFTIFTYTKAWDIPLNQQ